MRPVGRCEWARGEMGCRLIVSEFGVGLIKRAPVYVVQDGNGRDAVRTRRAPVDIDHSFRVLHRGVTAFDAADPADHLTTGLIS